MKKHRLIIAILSIFLLLLAAACNSPPKIDVNEALGKTEDYYRQYESRVTASAFDGKKDIKFRLMTDGPLSDEDAEAMFGAVMGRVGNYAGHPDFWEYYNGHFDIVSYKDGVVYNADKLIGKDMELSAT